MAQTSSNQEHGRKRGRSRTKAVTNNQPSRAPGQDQPMHDLIGKQPEEPDTHGYKAGEEQGISNRPAHEEHAFPAPDAKPPDDVDPDTFVPQHQGGNRGGI